MISLKPAISSQVDQLVAGQTVRACDLQWLYIPCPHNAGCLESVRRQLGIQWTLLNFRPFQFILSGLPALGSTNLRVKRKSFHDKNRLDSWTPYRHHPVVLGYVHQFLADSLCNSWTQTTRHIQVIFREINRKVFE